MKKRLFLILVALIVFLGTAQNTDAFASSDGGQSPPNADTRGSAGDGFVPGEVLAPADSPEHAEEIAAAYGLKLKSYAQGIAVLIASQPEQAVALSGRMRRPGIPALSMNWVYTHDTYENTGTATRSYNTSQWHHEEMDTLRAWGTTRGAGVVTAVIDSGIDINHPAFIGRISEKSYNAHTDQAGISYAQDDNGHGTHVSGIIAAAAGAENVHGVAPEAVIMAIKANMPSATSSYQAASVYRAINYAADNGAGIINLSIGRPFEGGFDALERQIIINAIEKGVTVIAAAGNSSHFNVSYPAAYPEVIGVSALMHNGVFDDRYSNFGPQLDISAPGSHILSAQRGGGYVTMSGTSMAAPNAAGVAALIKAKNPGYTPQQVRDALVGTAQYRGGELGRNNLYGNGMAHAYAAMLGFNALNRVAFDFNDGLREPVLLTLVPGSRLVMPVEPGREGYGFKFWAASPDSNAAFSFPAVVSSDITLYARWEILTNSWQAVEGGVVYYVDGVRKVNWFQIPEWTGENWYYADRDGIVQRGWFQIPEAGDNWYYADWNGIVQRGWFQIPEAGGNWYYADWSGVIQRGWFQIPEAGDNWYYADWSGVIQRGWFQIPEGGDNRYFADWNGRVYVDRTFEYGGVTYIADWMGRVTQLEIATSLEIDIPLENDTPEEEAEELDESEAIEEDTEDEIEDETAEEEVNEDEAA